MRARIGVVLGLSVVGLSLACVVVDPAGGPRPSAAVRGPGPPPHAPAHGYRAQHRDRDLVYDAGVGAYVVVGFPDLWFFDGSFVRWSGARWEVGAEATGPWRVAPLSAVPVKLRDRHHPHGGPPGQTRKHGRD
jgi:hypothetical protein